MKVAIISDTHWGIRNNHTTFLDQTKKFLDDTFFPYIDDNKIDCVYHLGDLVDHRKYININTAKRLREDFLDPIAMRCSQRQLQFSILAGNHDVYYKNTNDINIFNEFVCDAYPSFNVYSEPTSIEVDGTPVCIIPWINDSNKQTTLAEIAKTKAKIAFGHLEIPGFEMDQGHVCQTGLAQSTYRKFDTVLTGHFHHRSSAYGITYVGAPVQFTWADYADVKGFHIFDTDTLGLQFIENPIQIFKKVLYDDRQFDFDTMDWDQLTNCMVKLIVQHKSDPVLFDKVLDKIEHVDPAHWSVTEEQTVLETDDDGEIIAEAEDTLTLFTKFIDQMDGTIDKDALKAEIQSLYKDAVLHE